MKKRDFKKLLRLSYTKLSERKIPLNEFRMDASSGLTIIPRVNGIYIFREDNTLWFDTYHKAGLWSLFNYTGGPVNIVDISLRLRKYLPANGACKYIEIY